MEKNHRLLSEADARALLFPQASAFSEVAPARVTAASKVIGRDPAVTMVAARLRVWRVQSAGADAGWLVTDSVIGKFEKIDYAVALSADGEVQRVEVLAYRESHGHEVMERNWLAQFAGAGVASVLKVGKDIDGVTGATLSCVHLSEGVRRVTRLVHALRTTAN